MKMSNLRVAALALSLFALLSNAEISATTETCFNQCHGRHGKRERVEAAQANYQDETPLIPTADQPIPFAVKNFRSNFEVNNDKTVFEVVVPGLYSIDAFLLVNVPNIGDSVGGYITINGEKLLTFFASETRTGSPIVNFHFNDRLVYLQKGDQISVVFSDFTPGTTILSRGFVIVALNNAR